MTDSNHGPDKLSIFSDKKWFFIVGAQKAGTTTIHDALYQHQDVCLPAIKETHFFSQSNNYALGEKWYAEQFKKNRNAKVWGEVNPEYMFYPKAPNRISKSISPSVIVIIIREPISRAYSHYLMSVRRGVENMTFRDAMSAENSRANLEDVEYMSYFSYKQRGMYSEQIKRLKDKFRNSKFIYIKFESLMCSGGVAETVNKIRESLGLCHISISGELEKASNSASVPVFKGLQKLLQSKSKAKKFLRLIVPSKKIRTSIALYLDRVNRKPKRYNKDEIYEWVSDEIKAEFSLDLIKTEELTGLDLSDWKKIYD